MEPIVIEHLSKQYGKLLAVNDLSLAVERGVCVGFLGPNGAGKTTTIKMLTNLLRATNGKAYLNGVDVIRHPKAALDLSLIHISEPTRLGMISYAVFCLKK